MEDQINTLELNLASAKDLNNLNLFAKMDVYAVVFISGDTLHNQKTRSPVDKAAGTNPAWNFPVKLTFNKSLAHQNRLFVEIRLRSQRSLAVDRDIGSVNVSLKELLDYSGDDGETFQHVSYQVRKPSGKPKGTLNFSYKFGQKLTSLVNPKAEHVNAYSYPAPTLLGYSSVAYPPPPLPYAAAGFHYQQPPQPVFGYPQQATYVYPPQPVYGYPPHLKNNFGMGL